MMSIWRDRQVKQYFIFLFLNIFLLFLAGLWLHQLQSDSARRLYLSVQEEVAGSLLEQGVSEEVIAKAVTGKVSGGAGAALMQKIGITERTAISFLPPLAELSRRNGYFMLAAGSILSVLLLSGSVLFFVRRERLYQRASEVTGRFMEGDFTRHLTQIREGGIYQFFASVDRLAMMLQSKNEAQAKTRDFLKRTISDISHQLKTPLAALAMYREIISQEAGNADIVAEYSDKMELSLNRMEQLIRSLLKITSLDAGSIRFEKDSYYLADLLACSVGELKTRAEREGKEIRLEGPKEGRILCDLEWTSEALENIIKNALDHTKEGECIQIIWECTPLMVRVTIADNGTGIPLEDIHHIFKRFYRSRHSLDQQGVGLGLSLAKSIIEGQGGLISVTSPSGMGASFTVSFPLD